jgi:dUTP pyrophosphatase
MLVKFKKLQENAKAPSRAYRGDAGWDLYATERITVPALQDSNGRPTEVKIGLAFEVPEGWQLQIHTRSSSGKRGLRCHLGVVDAGYRNEVTIFVFNNSTVDYVIEPGDKIAQAIFLPVPDMDMEEAAELSQSERGLKGVGSSGR